MADRTLTKCPAERAVRALEGRWKIFIVFHLLDRTLRFAELQRAISGASARSITAKMLTQELRELESDGLVNRHVYAQVPPKVEYTLTSLGRGLHPIIDAMSAWGRMVEQAPAGERLS